MSQTGRKEDKMDNSQTILTSWCWIPMVEYTLVIFPIFWTIMILPYFLQNDPQTIVIKLV